MNEECLICEAPLEYLDADFFFLNELGDIIPIRNLIIGAGNIGIHLIKLFAVLKAIFESCLHSSIRLITSGIFLNSAGLIPTSQRQYRGLLLIYSTEPTNFLIYFTALGSFFTNSS